MSRALEGTTAVVTGAGRGLGRAIAVGFARAGSTVWICARTTPELDVTSGQIRREGGRVHTCRVDLSLPGECLAFVAEVRARSPRVDVLVNNAAVLDLIDVETLPPAAWARTLAVNLTAPFLLTQAFLPGMRQHGGSIVNVSSRAGVMPFARESAYCASKFGLEGFTRSVALELEGAPVSINTVTPGLRIKPTSITDADVASGGARNADEWHDPSVLVDAFIFLARLRGKLSGLRFDAQKLSAALASAPQLAPAQVLELAE